MVSSIVVHLLVCLGTAELVNHKELGDAAAGEATQRIADILRNVHHQRRELSRSSESPHASFAGEEWLPPERHCGKPFEDDHELDRSNLFLPIMYATPDQPSENVSTLYCKREMFRGFFGLHKMPIMTFNAAFVTPLEIPAPAHSNAADLGFDHPSLGCTECKNLEDQMSVHQRTVDVLREENKRSREASRDLEVEMAALKDSAKTEKHKAEEAANQIRAERDTLQARIARLEQMQAEKDGQDIEVTRLKAQLQEALGDLTKGRESGGRLQSQLLHLENEARELRAKVSGVEEEKSGLQHRLAQRTQELESQTQGASAKMAQKDGAIQTLEANLDRSSDDLKATIQKARDFRERWDAQVAATQVIQAELDQLRQEGEEKDAANDNLDDRTIRCGNGTSERPPALSGGPRGHRRTFAGSRGKVTA